MHILHLPRLGQTMQQGSITAWLVEPGKPFEIGDVIYELETEKNTVEVEAKVSGSLYRILVDNDEFQPVGVPIAVLAEPGEVLEDAAVDAALAAEAGGGTDSEPSRRTGPAPAAPAEAGAARPPGRVRIVPRARKLAADLGVDITALTGSGREGTITVEDVQAAAASAATGTAAATATAGEVEPLTGVARAMAESVTRAWATIPQFVQQITVDASGPAARRAAAPAGERPSYTDLVVAATAKALAAVPQVNAVYVDGGLRRHPAADIGVAVDTPRGLLVPVLPAVDPDDVALLHRRLREMVDRSSRGTLRPEDQSPAAVTVSNLGAYGVETGFPLVTEGQTALVFVGALVERTVVVNGGIVVRPQIGVAIAYDHRVVDGATAARFTAALKAALEAPA